MGFMKWLARIGAVGGTARWAARTYEFFRRRHPDSSEIPDNSIFRLMIVQRYEALPDQKAEQVLLSRADRLFGLRDLVTSVLIAEAGFADNTPSVQSQFLEVIEEELERAGVTRQVIIGSRSISPYSK